MFPRDPEFLKAIGIEKTLRLLPHDQDTGGFYVCGLRKLGNVCFAAPETPKPPTETEKTQEGEEGMVQEKPKADLGVEAVKEGALETEDMEEGAGQKINQKPARGRGGRWIWKNNVEYSKMSLLSPEGLVQLQEYYGLDPALSDRFFVSTGSQKKVAFVSEKVADFVSSDQKKRLKMINMGLRAFEQRVCRKTKAIEYRVTQEGAEMLFNSIAKRKAKVSMEEFLFVASNISIAFKDIKPEYQALAELSKMDGLGYYILYVESEEGEPYKECLVVQKFIASFSLMASKLHI